MRSAGTFTTILGCLLLLSVSLCLPAYAWERSSEKEVDHALEGAVRKGVEFLLRTQHADGSWGESTTGRWYEVLAMVPGSHRAFRVASSALCVMALQNSRIEEKPVQEAIRKGLGYLVKHGRVKRANSREHYNVWSFAYCLRCFSEALSYKTCPELEPAMRKVAAEIVKALELYQVPDGGWGYLDFSANTYRPSDSSLSFTTATEVISLFAAKKVGIRVPEKMIRKAMRSLRRCRLKEGRYLYGWYLRYYAGMDINKIKGSACRTPCCHLGLYYFTDRVSYRDFVKSVEDLIKENKFCYIARKYPIPHEAWYSNSGYFYLYGHYYASLVLKKLKAEDQSRLWPSIRGLLLSQQEPDGSWWDYPLYGYHKAYGTGYALLTLCWDRYGDELYRKDEENRKN